MKIGAKISSNKELVQTERIYKEDKKTTMKYALVGSVAVPMFALLSGTTSVQQTIISAGIGTILGYLASRDSNRDMTLTVVPPHWISAAASFCISSGICAFQTAFVLGRQSE